MIKMFQKQTGKYFLIQRKAIATLTVFVIFASFVLPHTAFASDTLSIKETSVEVTDSDLEQAMNTETYFDKSNGDNFFLPERNEDFTTELFGSNVYLFSPEDDPVVVNEILQSIYRKQEANQFGDDRYAVYFLPGEYDDSIEIDVGFYTQVSGLGRSPKDTSLPMLRCLARWLGDDSNHNATCNFWRGAENFSSRGNVTWAVSQATFLRRVFIDASLYLHDDYGWASGGFLSDSRVTRMIDGGTQQQWLSRNNEFSIWMNENWNLVFLGDEPGCDPTGTWPGKAYTSIEKTPVIREKPFLIYDEEEGFLVEIPAIRTDSQGISWKNGQAFDPAIEREIPLNTFYIAHAETDTSETLNQALANGMHLFFTPGIYTLDEPLLVTTDHTVILGTGLATLRPVSGQSAMITRNTDGLILAGILFDAGRTYSDNLLIVGEKHEVCEIPISLSDLFFRVGGAYSDAAASCGTCMIINASNVIGDNFWIWRADHGDHVAWDENTVETGLVVNGDDVSIYCLMVEHFQKYQTIWNGENGRTYMYQSELPYDVPKQSVWQSNDGTVNGYASFKVSDEVKTFEGIAWGIYAYNRDASVEEYHTVEVPETPGVTLHNICAVLITGHPGISHVVNDAGRTAYNAGDRSLVIDYPEEN